MTTQRILNNRYCIIRKLGDGGFGETFLGEDSLTPSKRPCVIKQLKPVASEPKIAQLVRERFQREAAILEELGDGCSQIPKLYAYLPEGGHFYLVQEWIEGKTLSDKVGTEGLIGEDEVREMLASLLSVLDYVHSKRIVHRDIKPDNIIWRKSDCQPVLIDFSAVKEAMATVASPSGNNVPSSIVIGTPGFMPPEQGIGRPVYASDLYSLGLTAIYLLTGKPPQHLETDPGSGEIVWHEHAQFVSSSLVAVLDKAIRSHPRDRYSTAKEMLYALERSATNLPTTAATFSPTNQPTVAVAPRRPQPTSMFPNPGLSQRSVLISTTIGSSLIGASIIIGLVLIKPNPQAPQSSSPDLNTPTTGRSTPEPAPVPPPSGAPQPPSSPVASTPTTPGSTPEPAPVPPPSATPQPTSPPVPGTPTLDQPLLQSPAPVPPPSGAPQPPSSPVPGTPTDPPVTPPPTEDYPWPWLSLRRVTESDLVGKTAFELSVMRNSIYAFHGRRFNNRDLQSYFNNQSWYRPKSYAPEEFPAERFLIELEINNAFYIKRYQDRNGLNY